MEHNLFTNLLPEIIIEILSRLPVRTIVMSKCVCKSWLDLLETDYFVNLHLSKSVPSLAVWMAESNRCEVFDFEDKVDDVESSSNVRRYYPLTKFDFPHSAVFESSANGLLLLNDIFDTLYICNPITRRYVEICCPEEFVNRGYCKASFMLGASRISKQFKVVRISGKSKCHVYTLGTGSSWRRLGVEAAQVHLLKCYGFRLNTFVDGHIYWKVKESFMIGCFDFETECFSSFCAPAPTSRGALSAVLRDRLCFCESKDRKISLWLMKDNGVEKCWMKEYVIAQGPVCDVFSSDFICPIKVFKNGDILMRYGMAHFYYCNETKTIQENVGIFAPCAFSNDKHLTPSFLSLKGLGMENVISF